MSAILQQLQPFDGVLEIARFNWPRYAAAVAVIVCAVVADIVFPLPRWMIAIEIAAIAPAAFWLAASLLASHIIYDRSRLRDWRWIAAEALQDLAPPRRWINLHAGLDESTPALRRIFPGSSGRVLDIFDGDEMTERSIRRARAAAKNHEPAEPADYRRLPLDEGSCDAAMLLLSAHELRRPEARATLFAELRRALDSVHGRIVLAEHLRDPANFLAFGPGFLHFFRRRSWLDAARAAGGLELEREFRITPFITVLVFRRSS
jgi:hypothetical protein